MATITISEARARAAITTTTRVGVRKSAASVLAENVARQTTDKTYDVFLSHASVDAEIILGVKGIIQDHGYTVYIDWIDDPDLDRKNVTPETADTLRHRMNVCRSLFYTTTQNSSSSKWMPWECGYFDGKSGRAAILPVTASKTNEFDGQEYLGLYPYIVEDKGEDGKSHLWVHRSPKIYVEFGEWLNGKEPKPR
jgi:hypothetical protein